MADARKLRFDGVCVWKLDRWGRSVADSIKSIQKLTSLGVRFIAVTQNIDTDESKPMARFLLHIMAAFAELEHPRARGGWRQGRQGQRQALGATEARVPTR
jgi:putative DNA-invertase from lambdoid prophage Rac